MQLTKGNKSRGKKMSEEIIRLIGCMDQTELDTQIALQCAPILAGIKLSNILIVRLENKERVTELFSKTEISCEILYLSTKRVTFLVYRKEVMSEYLKSMKIKEYMNLQGYYSTKMEAILTELSNRYQSYMERCAQFPHELGLLLGYPIEDVRSFVENQGKNFLFTGYWKVYHNPEETRKLFEQYSRATEKFMGLIHRGFKMNQIITTAGILETI